MKDDHKVLFNIQHSWQDAILYHRGGGARKAVRKLTETSSHKFLNLDPFKLNKTPPCVRSRRAVHTQQEVVQIHIRRLA